MFLRRPLPILRMLAGAILLAACTSNPSQTSPTTAPAPAGSPATPVGTPAPSAPPSVPTISVAPSPSPAGKVTVASPSPATKVAGSPSPAAKVGTSPSPVSKVAPSPSPAARAPSPSPSPGPTQAITFTMTDHTFSGPDSVPAGWTRIRAVNQGQELHHLTLLKLASGRTVTDFVAAVQANPETEPPNLFTEAGGPNAVIPGAEGTAFINLEPGQYVLVCFIPSPDGTPHVAKGMVRALTVTPATGAAAGEPRAAATIAGFDFGYRIDPSIAAGSGQIIKFTNEGQQHHEVLLVQLPEGKSIQDFAAAAAAPDAGGSPPPGTPLGGIGELEPGQSAYFVGSFAPGRYGLICFLADERGDGASHFTKGMVAEFTVR